jgi:hypothetical protein
MGSFFGFKTIKTGSTILLYFCPNHANNLYMFIFSMESKRNKSDTPRPDLVLNNSNGITFSNAFKINKMGKIKDNWAWVLFITFLTACLSLGGQWVFRGCDKQATVIEKSVAADYVDKKNEALQTYVDNQDNAIRSTISEGCNITTARMDRIQLQLNTKADKDDFDKLWQLTNENNRLLIELAAKQGIK